MYTQSIQQSYSENHNAQHLIIWRISCITFQFVEHKTTTEININQNVALLIGKRGHRKHWCKNSFCILQLMMEDRLFILDQSGLPAVQSCPLPEMWRTTKHIIWQLRLRRAPSPPVMYHSRTKLKSAFKSCEAAKSLCLWGMTLRQNTFVSQFSSKDSPM